MARGGFLLILGALLLGCGGSGDDPASTADVTPDAGETTAPDAEFTVARPAPPALPVPPALPADANVPRFTSWECPAGWSARSALSWSDTPPAEPAVADWTVCEPPTPPEACPPGMMPVVGEGACVRQSPECPGDGLWASEEELRARAPDHTGRIWYVAPPQDGAPQAQGTRAAPFRSVQSAISQASANHIVALATGLYEEEVDVGKGLAVLGACTEGTTIHFDGEPEYNAILDVFTHQGPGVYLVRDLTVSGTADGVYAWADSGDMTFKGLRVKDTTHLGFTLISNDVPAVGAVLLEDFVVVGTRADPETPYTNAGIYFPPGGRATVRRAWLHDNSDRGMLIDGAETDITLDGVVATSQSPDNSSIAAGVSAASGSHVLIRRSWIGRNRTTGLLVENEGRMTVEETVVMENGVDVSSPGGVMVHNAELTASHCLITQNHGRAGINLLEDGRAEVRDTVIAAPNGEPEDASGVGVALGRDASIDAERLLIAQRRLAGVLFDDDSIATLTQARLADVLVVETHAVGGVGAGLAMLAGGHHVTTERLMIARTLGASRGGIDQYGGVLSMTDLIVVDTESSFGVSMLGDVTLERGLLARNSVVGFLSSGGTARLSDLTVIDTRSGPDKQNGYGMEMGNDIDLHLTRARFERNRSGGVIVRSNGPDVVLEDITITDTQPQELDGGLGVGLAMLIAHTPSEGDPGRRLRAERIEISRNHIAGALLAGGVLELTDATIRDTMPPPVPQEPGNDGQGIVQDVNNGWLTLNRALVERNHGLGVWLGGSEGRHVFRDLTVVGTLPRVGGAFGRGIEISSGDVLIERAELRENRGIGLFAANAKVEMTDVKVSDTLPGLTRLGTPQEGRGIQVQQTRETLVMERVLAERNQGVGIGITDCQVVLKDIVAREISRAVCEEGDPCPGELFGMGLVIAGNDVASHPTSMRLDSFEMAHNVLLGLMVYNVSDFKAERGQIHNNTIGLNLQSNALGDLGEAFDDVEIYDNGLDIDTQELPVPGAADAFESVLP